MTIGIDGNEANEKIRLGSGVFAFELLKQFKKSKADAFRASSKFKVYLKEKPTEDLPDGSDNWEYKEVGPKRFWTQFGLPFELWKEKTFGKGPDVFFTPTHYAPRFCPIPSIITIFDLSFIKFPEMFLKKDLYQLRNWTDYSIKQAKKIITISQFSKEEIVDHYQVSEDKVIVTYPGYDKNKFKVQSSKFKVNELKKRYKIDGDYVLFVGTLQPRKNIVRLIEAFNIAMKKFNNESMKLIIAGKKGWLYEEIFQKVKELSIEKRVIFTDYVKEEDLPGLYGSAKCLVLPSIYEGFGIPVLEAMACGCPVVVSNVSSLPEIVGEAGILVDPLSTISIAQGIEQVCYDNLRRDILISKGLDQVKKFSWERCARTTLEVLEKL